VIVGRRQEENLAGLVRELRLGGAVHFYGEVSEEELPDFYRAASVFVMPAWEEESTGSVEGFGIVFLEAAASGIPSIGGKSGGIPDAIRDPETGFLVDAKNEEALAASLIDILSHDEKRKAMGRSARQLAENEFDWGRAAGVVEAQMRRAVSGARQEARQRSSPS
jgi:phosphatidylinositol alpha-1,6-mannosyltransferase